MTLAELKEKIQAWEDEGFLMDSEIRDDENPEYAISDMFYAKEEDRIYFVCEEVK
jgi:hypothetical protein